MLSNPHLFKVFLNKKNISATDERFAQFLEAAEVAIKRYCHRDFEQVDYPGAALGGPGDSGYYDGTGTQELLLRQTPVHGGTVVVHQDAGGYYGAGANAFPATTLLTEGTDYVLKRDGDGANQSASGILLRLGGASTAGIGTGEPWPPYTWNRAGSLAGRSPALWPRGIGNLRIHYRAGFPPDSIPADLLEAVHQLAAWMMRSGHLGGVPLQSESLGNYSYSVAQNALQSIPELGTSRQLLSRFRRLEI